MYISIPIFSFLGPLSWGFENSRPSMSPLAAFSATSGVPSSKPMTTIKRCATDCAARESMDWQITCQIRRDVAD